MRGSIIKRSKHSYSIVIPVVDPVTGKRKQKWITVQGKRERAEEELARHVNDVHHGAFVAPVKLTLSAFLDKFVLIHCEQNVAATTLARYRSIIEHHLKPALGGLPLVRLTPIHIQEFYAALARGGRKDGREGGLSAQTVLHTHRLISAALTKAVRWQLLARNPAEGVEAPKVRPHEVEVIDEAQTAWLIEVSKGTRLYIPILLTSCTGMRRGEILAASWPNVDWMAGTLRVTRALIETKDRGVEFKETKGKHSRTVALPPLLVDALKLHKAEQDKVREALGTDYRENGLICCQPSGEVWVPSAFTSAYRDLLRRRKLAGPNFHALRHSHASIMLRNGVDLKEVSARLGHSKASFTLTQYCHLLPGQDQEAARRVDAVLRKAMSEVGKAAPAPQHLM